MHIFWLVIIPCVMITASVDTRPDTIPSGIRENPSLTPADRFKRQIPYLSKEAWALWNQLATATTTEPPRPTCPMFTPKPEGMSFDWTPLFGRYKCCVKDDKKYMLYVDKENEVTWGDLINPGPQHYNDYRKVCLDRWMKV
ncbi:uncharacterized protein LOC129591153 [Paramacrobiotus metropolitanus]|uniref:uncharacterized protein LOC129591153 n=1 Tax=Paramacrobiotus metropolitanus TaxID=2943436 RepID=UPI00244574C4|nr:uncharacterized protein LOC129591153 [Paramacrobiotus metropolitanus]